jgi:hypothetical protein
MTSRWNVTSLVQDWIRDPMIERRRVVLIGPERSVVVEDSSDTCLSFIVDRRLEIDYVVLR